MNRRFVLACLTGCLAILAVWLLVNGIAQAADPPLSPRYADSPLSVPSAVPTPTLRLSGPGGETLISPSAHRMLVSDPSVSLYVYNPLTSEVSVTAQLVTLRSAAGQPLPATLGLSPASQTVVSKEVGTWTLSLIDGWLPAGQYVGTLRLSGAGTEPVSPEFVLLVSPWATELEWAEEAFAHMVDQGHSETTVRITARLGNAEDIRLELPTLAASDAMTKPFSTRDFLDVKPTSLATLKQDTTAAFTLTFAADRLPQPGTYRGELQLSASNAAAITAPFELAIPDHAPVTPWPAELEWAQKEFVYVADEQHSRDTFWVTARITDVQGVQATVTTLRPRDGITASIATDFLATPALPPTLPKDSAVSLTLAFTASAQPVPGTYDGTLQVSGSNAKPITTPFTLVIPDRAPGSYQLAVAELGKTLPMTSTGLTLTTALQFTGVRWLPGSTYLVGPWWPKLAGALLLGIALAALAGYTVWALRTKRIPWVVLVIAAASLAFVAVWVLPFVFGYDITQAHVGEHTLLVWEANGRGPVRDIKVKGGQVANDAGDTGWIDIDDQDGEIAPREGRARKIEAQQVLTEPFTVQGMSQPGVYQGRILIHSPDIKSGVHQVPVQVTVHDFILWPILVVLLGVVVGGYTKYLQDVARQRLEKQRVIERAWQSWDDYKLLDPYLVPESTDGMDGINPLYESIFHELERVRGLLDIEPEWGSEETDLSVSRAMDKLEIYQRLGQAIASWRDEVASARDEYAASQSAPTIATIAKLEKRVRGAERALERGNLHRATILAGMLTQEALPGGIEGLRGLVKDIPEGDENKTPLKNLLDAADDLWKKGVYGEAWLKFKEAEYKLRALGKLTGSVLLPLPKEKPEAKVSEDKLEDDGKGGRYEIRPVTPADRYYVKEPIRCSVVRYVDGAEKELPQKTWSWAGPTDESVTFDPQDEPVTQATFHSCGIQKVTATGTSNPTPTPVTVEREFDIRPYVDAIRPLFSNVRYRVNETITFDLVRLGDSGESLRLTHKAAQRIRAEWDIPGDGSKVATIVRPVSDGAESTEARIEFHKPGHWTVAATVTWKDGTSGDGLPPSLELPLSIRPSIIEMIYRDKQRLSYRRRLAAAAVAVAFGMAAKRVFGLTFGSFEQYLGAFIWGAGVSAGIDPAADAYAGVKNWLSTRLFKLKSGTEGQQTQEGGQTTPPAGGK